MTNTFPDGLKVFFRPVQPSDEGLLKELFYSHSPETVLYRYFTPMKHLPQEQVQRFVTLDSQNDMAVVGLISCEGRQKMIAVARYFRDRATTEAEVALTLHDDFQKRGISTYVMRYLAKVAADHGITTFRADVMAGNAGMMRVFHKISRKVEVEIREGVQKVRVALPHTSPIDQFKSESSGEHSREQPMKDLPAKEGLIFR